MPRPDAPQRLKASHAGHRQIHYDHVGRKFEIALAGGLAGLHLAHHGYFRL